MKLVIITRIIIYLKSVFCDLLKKKSSMNNFDYKKALPYVGVVLFFMSISLGFFYPQLQGKKLATHDQKQWLGGAKEVNDYFEKTDTVALWTNSMFGGMPSYYVGMRRPNNLISKFVRPLTTLGLERPALYIMWSLISFFILMMVLKVDIPIGILGSVGYAFSSYNFVILAAGHFAKVMALGYLPGILAGAILLRKKKYVLGFIVSGLFMSFEMISKHPQMTYYFFVFFISFYFLLELISDIKNNKAKDYFKSTILFATAIVLGILPSSTQLLTTQEYTPYSTRGQSELTITDKEDATTGLDRSYITNWSGGIAETWALLIPHAKGPGSSALSEYESAMKNVDRKYQKSMAGFTAYWGDQPYVGGPMYAGAIIMFLFVLALFIVDGMLKWSLVLASVITVMLSWGKNFPGLTNFFIDYFPMYNKFRAVVSIEIVALFAIPVMAALALKKYFGDREFLSERITIFGKNLKLTNEKAVYLAFGLTGGISLLFWLMPTVFFDFFKAGEYDSYVSNLQGNGWPADQVDDLLLNVEAARISLFKADAIRTFGLILAAALLLLAYAKNKLKGRTALFIIAGLVLVDMWNVNMRYMDVKKGFESKRKVSEPFPIANADRTILSDKSPDYRVLNIAVSTFNETGTSYFHHSLGGYNGAKLKNYQELVDFYLANEIQQFRAGLQGVKSMNDIEPILSQMSIINMLNTKYIIFNPDVSPIVNSSAQGSAWFVNDVKWVKTADEEMLALGQTDLKSTAVIRIDQKENIDEVGDGSGTIELITYDLDKMVYHSSTTSDQVAVLSEIWYPIGWTAYIEGEEIEISRANYLLRTINVPKGEHDIIFEFRPSSFYTGEKIALVSSLALILIMLFGVYLGISNKNILNANVED